MACEAVANGAPRELVLLTGDAFAGARLAARAAHSLRAELGAGGLGRRARRRARALLIRADERDAWAACAAEDMRRDADAADAAAGVGAR